MATAKKTPAKGPKTIGQWVDFIEVLQEERDQIKGVLEAKETEIKAALEHLSANFDAAELNGAAGSVGIAERKAATVARATDWDAIYAHIRSTGDFDLLHKRLGIQACRARWDEGKQIPGIAAEVVYELKVRAKK